MKRNYRIINKGKFFNKGKEFDYVLEATDSFPKSKEADIRIRIIDERPAIRKVRTRYDPTITMYGDKDASMELLLGYDIKDINKAGRNLIMMLIMPFYLAGCMFVMIFFPEDFNFRNA